MARVTFWGTTAAGQKEIGRIVYSEAGGLVVTGDAGDMMTDIFGEHVPSEPADIIAAMKRAPRIFDGAYVRAAFAESDNSDLYEEKV